MIFQERVQTFWTHIALHDPRVCGREIDDDQAVQCVPKGGIQVETDEFSPQFQVLLQENGKAFAVRLNPRYPGRHLFHVICPVPERSALQANKRPPVGIPRFDHSGEMGKGVVHLQKGDHELPGIGAIIVGNADGPEQHAVLRILDHIPADSLPEEQEGRVTLLVFGLYKGAPHLQGRAHVMEKGIAVPEKGVGVKTLFAFPRQQRVGPPETTGPCDVPPRFIPEKQVNIGLIKPVKIKGLTGTLARCLKGLLPQAPDLMEGLGDLLGLGIIEGECIALGQFLSYGETADFPAKEGGVPPGGDRLSLLPGPAPVFAWKSQYLP